MHVAYAKLEDLNYLDEQDHHIDSGMIQQKIDRCEILVLYHAGLRTGFLRYGYFWDEIPFMNMLLVEDGSRGRGFGTQLISFWEKEMRELGHDTVMTSSMSDERAQRLYRRLGYEDCGSLLMHGEPLEIVFLKRLSAAD